MPKPFDLQKLFQGALERLRVEAEFFSRLTDHGPELGRLNETHLVNLLRAYLPPKIGVGTGFISCGGRSPRQSPQCDIILYDALNNAPLYKSEAWSIFPIEMVYGVIEVKTTLRKARLREAFAGCAKIRAMATELNGDANKAYAKTVRLPNGIATVGVSHNLLPPRYFVFGYAGPTDLNSLRNDFVSLTMDCPDAHIHGLCTLTERDSLFIWHEPNREPAERAGSGAESDGFRAFLMNMPHVLDSMLPKERQGFGFGQLYLPHYHLPLAPSAPNE